MTSPDPDKYAPGVPKSQYGFQGNQDAYGVGIRAGYYTQAFTVWAANFFVPHEAPFLHSVNILFMFAMLSGLTSLVSKGAADVWAVEPFMLLNITYSVAWVGTCNPYVRESLPWEWTVKTGLVRQLSFLAVDAYALWFWYIGLPKMKPTIGDVGTEVYFYAAGDLFGGIRIANQVITVLDIVFRLGDLLCRGAVGYQDRQLDQITSAKSLKQQAWRWMPGATGERDLGSGILEKTPSVSKEGSISILSRTDTASSLSKASTRYWTPPKLISRSSSRRTDPSDELPMAYHPTREALDHAEELFDAVLVTESVTWFRNFVECVYLPLTAVPAVLHAAVRGHLRPRLIMPIFQHLSIQPDPQTHQFVRSLRRLLGCGDVRRGEVDWRALAIIMRFRIAIDPPPPAPKRKRIGQMLHTLGIGIVLAIGTELTIQWNYIRGVQQVDSVGQLIPLSLGVGGLLKVVWGAIVGDEDWCGKSCALEKRLQQWREPALLWNDAKLKSTYRPELEKVPEVEPSP